AEVPREDEQGARDPEQDLVRAQPRTAAVDARARAVRERREPGRDRHRDAGALVRLDELARVVLVREHPPRRGRDHGGERGARHQHALGLARHLAARDQHLREHRGEEEPDREVQHQRVQPSEDREVLDRHASSSGTTRPKTSVRRKSRPWWRYTSFSWSRPSWRKSVACRSWTSSGFSTTL